jgi:hypothetical protein
MIRPGQSVGTKTVARMPRSASSGAARVRTESNASSKVTAIVLGAGGRVTASVNVVPTQTCEVRAASWRRRLRGRHRKPGVPAVTDRVVAEDEDAGHRRHEIGCAQSVRRMTATMVSNRAAVGSR